MERYYIIVFQTYMHVMSFIPILYYSDAISFE